MLPEVAAAPAKRDHQFFLGVHHPSWLAQLNVPMMISRRRLVGRRRLPRATAPVAIDSGGFSELSLHGRWTVSPKQYAAEVFRFSSEIGIAWAATQDMMCEPWILAKTRLSVEAHQLRTVQSYEDLSGLAPNIPWLPVLQGWTTGDYLDHVELYLRRGHDLRRVPLVGVGSICRRQWTLRSALLIRELASEGLRLHGFGFKVQGLRLVHRELVSSDSMAWSFNARRNRPLPGCSHARCSNCPTYALEWRNELLESLERKDRRRFRR